MNGYLFATKTNNGTVADQISLTGNVPITQNDWTKKGREEAKRSDGSKTALELNIQSIFDSFKKVERVNTMEQEKRKTPYKVKKKDLLAEVNEKEVTIMNIKDVHIPREQEKIEKRLKEIEDIRTNPGEYLNDPGIKPRFVIGSIIMTFQTVYLFFFYSSASYSAFFKVFSLSNIGVVNSIFDPKALTNAMHDGFAELIFIITIPFVFLALGLLIHMFQQEKSFWRVFKISLVIILTFLFDGLLAYEISEKIYNIKAGNSFMNFEPYSVSLAVRSVMFWLIIFSGFLVYVLWGLMFDRLIEAYSQLNKSSYLIRFNQEQIASSKRILEKKNEEIAKIKDQIIHRKAEIEKLEHFLAEVVFVNVVEILEATTSYLKGWVEWLSSDGRTEEKLAEARNIGHSFITNLSQNDTITLTTLNKNRNENKS